MRASSNCRFVKNVSETFHNNSISRREYTIWTEQIALLDNGVDKFLLTSTEVSAHHGVYRPLIDAYL